MDVLTKLMDLQERGNAPKRKAFDEPSRLRKLNCRLKNRVGTVIANMPIGRDCGSGRPDHHKPRSFVSLSHGTNRPDYGDSACLHHRAGHYEETTLSGPADQSGAKNAIR
jgi:hypothetical protein